MYDNICLFNSKLLRPDRRTTNIKIVLPTGFQKRCKSNLRQQTNVRKTTKPASDVSLLMFYYYHFISRLTLIYLRKSSMDDKRIRLCRFTALVTSDGSRLKAYCQRSQTYFFHNSANDPISCNQHHFLLTLICGKKKIPHHGNYMNRCKKKFTTANECSNNNEACFRCVPPHVLLQPLHFQTRFNALKKSFNRR